MIKNRGNNVNTKQRSSLIKPLWETEARAGPKLEARTELLQAAATAFMTGGYANTTLDDVAALTGMSKGQIYHYYRSKTDLYFDVVVGAMFMLNARVLPIAKLADLPVEERLRRVAFEHVMEMMRMFPFQKVGLDAAQHRFHADSSQRERRAMQRTLQLRNQYEALINELIAQGVAAGAFEVSSVPLATKSVLGALNWFTIWYDPARSPSEAHRVKIATRTADFVVAGLKPSDISMKPFAKAARLASASLTAYG
jgi:AcrR family transcriptional regulator